MIDLAEASVDLLRAHGPMLPEAWAELIVAHGIAASAEAADLVESGDHPLVGLLADGRAAALDTLLDDRLLTHRLSADEIAADVLDASPDLGSLADLADGADGADGIELVFAPSEDDPDADGPAWLESMGLALAPGSLAGMAPGDLVGLRADGGRLRLVRVEGALPDEDLADALAAIVPRDDTITLDAAVWQAMADHDELFLVPAPPLAEILAAAELVRRADYVAHAGFDFDAARKNTLVAMTADIFHVGRPAAAAMVEIKQLQEVPEAALPAAIELILAQSPSALDGLERYELGPAISRQIDQSLAFSAARPADAQALADTMRVVAIALAAQAPRPGAHFLAGLMALRLGRAAEADEHFRATVALDETWVPAYRELAGLATMRGEFAAALTLFERVPAAERDSLYEMLLQIDKSPQAELGRNDRCWCGSGRKYKVCHLGKPMLDASARATVLYNKAMEFVRTSAFVPQLVDLGGARAKALGDGFIFDLLLFEGDAFADFADKLGDLLPADELATAAQWLLGTRSVYEVEAVEPGVGLTVREVHTGERREVSNRLGSRRVRAGQLLCTRLVAVGGGYEAYGGLEPVDPADEAELAEILAGRPDPLAVVALLSRRHAA